eukprot:353939-Chlamydomonas_euryale.AAC.26
MCVHIVAGLQAGHQAVGQRHTIVHLDRWDSLMCVHSRPSVYRPATRMHHTRRQAIRLQASETHAPHPKRVTGSAHGRCNPPDAFA